ncbi:hypothetical protein MOUN0_A05688 [Monosporozyma unispora]
MSKISRLEIVRFLTFIFTVSHVVSALNVDADTTLSGDQTFNEPITVASGATLIIQSGSSYTFNDDIDIEGTLKVIGNPTTGATNLNFASTSTITNNGEFDLENLAPPVGAARQYVMAPGNFYNNGKMTISKLASTYSDLRNFTLAPANMVNKGTVVFSHDSDGKDSTGFLHIGGSGSTISNTGVISAEGSDAELYYKNFLAIYPFSALKGITIDSPITGDGYLRASGAFLNINAAVSNTQILELYNSPAVISYFETPLKYYYINRGGAVFVWDTGRNNPPDLPSSNIFGVDYTVDGNEISFMEYCEVGSGGFATALYVDMPSGGHRQMGNFYIPDTPMKDCIPASITLTSAVTTKVSTLTTSSFTVTTTDDNGNPTSVVVESIESPYPKTSFTTTTGSFTEVLTFSYTNTMTDNNGSPTPTVAEVIETPFQIASISSSHASSPSSSSSSSSTASVFIKSSSSSSTYVYYGNSTASYSKPTTSHITPVTSRTTSLGVNSQSSEYKSSTIVSVTSAKVGPPPASVTSTKVNSLHTSTLTNEFSSHTSSTIAHIKRSISINVVTQTTPVVGGDQPTPTQDNSANITTPATTNDNNSGSPTPNQGNSPAPTLVAQGDTPPDAADPRSTSMAAEFKTARTNDDTYGHSMVGEYKTRKSNNPTVPTPVATPTQTTGDVNGHGASIAAEFKTRGPKASVAPYQGIGYINPKWSLTSLLSLLILTLV